MAAIHGREVMYRSRFKSRGRRAEAGFNLVEVLVVLIILGVVLAIAGPSFNFVVNSGRVTNVANELLATMPLARIEAVRRGARTVVCRSENANSSTPSCTTAAGNWGGWVAFVDTDRDGAIDTGEAILKVSTINAPATLAASAAVSGANSRVVFRPDGMARTAAGALLAAQLRVCVPATVPAENARDVVVRAGGRFTVTRSAVVVTAGACAAPADT